MNALAGKYYVPIQKWTDIKGYVAQLKKPQVREKFQTVIFDTISIAFNLCEKYICQREGVDSIADVPWGRGFSMVRNEFQETLREITMLDLGLILICHSKERKSDYVDDEGNPIMAVEPDLPKNAYQVANSIVDLIGYIGTEFDKTTGESTRYLYTRETPTIFAGNRWKYLPAKLPFSYDNLVEAIGEAIDKSIEIDGGEVTDKTTNFTEETRSFQDVMEEAKTFWIGYLDGAADDEEKEHRANIMNDIIIKVFGKPIKLSSCVPSQIDLVALVVDEFKALV